MYQVNALHTLNLDNVTRQLYLNKAEEISQMVIAKQCAQHKSGRGNFCVHLLTCYLGMHESAPIQMPH